MRRRGRRTACLPKADDGIGSSFVQLYDISRDCDYDYGYGCSFCSCIRTGVSIGPSFLDSILMFSLLYGVLGMKIKT
jgi:hypothetical protein